MNGKMLWFNEAKDSGLVATDDGERLPVLGSGFAGGMRPERRCSQSPVVFDVCEIDGRRWAENVVFVEAVTPRRARLRSRPVSGTR
jgi:hypothetical protein